MSETTVSAGTSRPMDARPFCELRDTGLLWLINRVVFHPRGYALALVYDDRDNPHGPGGTVLGWQLKGDGTEPWSMGDPPPEAQALGALTEDDLFRLVKAIIP